MRFGNSAVVRVGRSSAASVRVGRAGDRPVVRVGADPNVQPGYENGATQPDPTQRYRPMGTTRASVLKGDIGVFLFTPCEVAYLQNLLVPESIAVNFDILSIKVCRVELLESGAVPAETFSNQAGTHLNRIMFGLKAYPSIPVTVTVKNTDTSDHDFIATIFISTGVTIF